MIKIGVLGSHGRMGQWVVKLIETEYEKHASLHMQVDVDQTHAPLLETDVVIDFSSPLAMAELAQKALTHQGPVPCFVIGSTGWTIDQRKPIEELARKTPVLMSSNFSTGVMALTEILRQSAPILEKLGYTPVVVETHHRHKKDRPSGTALSLQRAIAPAGPGNVQTLSVRAGEVIGDHEVTFYGPADHLTLGHFAQDRSIFARGAIDAALWLARQRASGAKPEGLLGSEAFFKSLKN